MSVFWRSGDVELEWEETTMWKPDIREYIALDQFLEGKSFKKQRMCETTSGEQNFGAALQCCNSTQFSLPTAKDKFLKRWTRKNYHENSVCSIILQVLCTNCLSIFTYLTCCMSFCKIIYLAKTVIIFSTLFVTVCYQLLFFLRSDLQK